MKPDPGKRFCPECKEQCSIIKKECPACDFKFVQKVKSPPREIKKPEIFSQKRIVPKVYADHKIYSTTMIPAGRPFIELKKDWDEQDVIQWVHTVREHYLKVDRSWLFNRAFSYWLQHRNFTKEQLTTANMIIDQIEDLDYLDMSIEENRERYLGVQTNQDEIINMKLGE